MKTSYLILPVVVILSTLPSFSQQKLTLKECYEKAALVNPLSAEKETHAVISGLRDRNISKNRLPSVDAAGSILYNSSVIDLSNTLGQLPFPGIADAIDPLPHEQYKITLELNQVIYDGGAVRSARALEKADLEINLKQTETDLYKLRSQINGYYFNILLLTKQKELLNNYLDLINKRLKSMESALQNGVLLRSDFDVITSEKIRLEQQITENEIKRTAMVRILSGLIDTPVDPSVELALPALPDPTDEEISRPELQLFDLKKNQLDAGLRAVESKRQPKAYGFATLGYGNPPGNNFFRDEFAPFYILGAGVKWNVFDWNRSKNERQVIALQRNIIENRKNDLSENLKRLLDIKSAEIKSLQALSESDKELIKIRKSITAAAGSQFDNGTITATEYLNELNNEKQAVINGEIHRVNLVMAGIEYLNISGKDPE